MASNTEVATSKVILDGKEAEDELKRLTKLSTDLKKQLRLAVQSGDADGAKKLKKELSEVEKEAAAAKRELNSISAVMKNLNGASLKQMQGAQRQLTAEIRSSTRSTREEIEAIEAKKKQLRQLKTEIDKVQSSMAIQSGGFMGKMASGFNKYFTMGSSFVLAISGVALSLKSMISGNSELSDSFADVAKTAGLTIPEVKELYKELGKLDTRTSRKELLDLAYAAGKLGYTGKSEIVGFVKAADQIGVALSKDLGGNVEEAVNSLGKLVDIFKIKDKFGIEQALLNTGSAINALGASGTATESYIVEFTKRLGGIAPQAGVSIEKVLGLGATLDQLGQQVETSSTAVAQLLTKMFQKPGEYAKIAEMNVADFTKLLKTDANAALIKLLEGLNKNKGGLTELASKFGDLGVDGARAISVIGALSNNVDMLKDAQQLSNVEFAKGTSLTKEFNLKNDNMAGNLERVGKALRSAFVNSAVMSGLEKLVKWMASWGEIPLAEKLEQERLQVNVLASQLMEANVQATTRNKLYNELKALAPDVVTGINNEAIAYDKLRINLEKYNQQMINKIVLARKDAEIETMANDAADWVAKRTKAEQNIRAYMARSADFVYKRNKEAGDQLKFIVNNELLNFEQKYNLFWKSIDQLAKSNKGASQVIALDKPKVSTSYTMYLSYLEKEKKAVGAVNAVSDEKNELAKSLGISLGIASDQTAEYTAATNELANAEINYSKLKLRDLNALAAKGDQLAKDEIERRRNDKSAEEAYKIEQAIRKQAIDSEIALMEDGYKKQLYTIHSAYASQREAIIHELQSNKSLTANQKEMLNSTLLNLDKKYVDDYNDLTREQAIKQLQFNRQLITLQLAATREGSDEQYQLKKQQLDNEMAFEIATVTGNEEQKAQLITAIKEKYARQHAQEDEKHSLRLLDDQLKQDITALNEAEQTKLEALRQKRESGQISQKEYNKQLIAIQKEFTTKSLLLSIEKAQRELDILKAAGEDVTQAEATLAELRLRAQEVSTGKEATPEKSKWTTTDTLNASVDTARMIADAEFQISRDNNQRMLDNTLITLQQEREAALSNKRLTERQKEAINKQFDARERALKRAAWEKQHKADISQAWVNLALSVGKAAINTWPVPAIPMMAMAAVEGGLQVAAVTSQKVPEFAKGRYNVTGQQTGKQYDNVSYTGPAVTGLYTRPALVAESGAEMIIDAKTTRNLMMNFPDVIAAIHSARMPQFAEGRYTAPSGQPTSVSTSTDPALLSIIKENTEAMKQMKQQLEDGIRGKWSLNDLEKIQRDKSTLESSVNM